MKHITEYILEVTQLQLRLQDQIYRNYELLTSVGGNPHTIEAQANIPKAEDDLLSISVLSAQINNGINAITSHGKKSGAITAAASRYQGV